MILTCNETMSPSFSCSSTSSVSSASTVSTSPLSESYDKIATPPTGQNEETLKALMSRNVCLERKGMLLNTSTLEHEFEKWVGTLWYMVDQFHFDHDTVHVAVRTFSVYLSTLPTFVPWSSLKWERYASLWIGMKMKDTTNPMTLSLKLFLRSMLGRKGIMKSEMTRLLKAETWVLQSNRFLLSYPLASDYADVLLHMLDAGSEVRNKTFQVLACLSSRIRFVYQNPLDVAVTAIYYVNPVCIENLVNFVPSCHQTMCDVMIESMFK